MEQGGAINWVELDEERMQWDRNSELWYRKDARELIMNAKVKLATAKTVWFPLSEILEIHLDYWEQDDIVREKLPILIEQINKALKGEKDKEVKDWLVRAREFVSNAYELGKDLTVCL
jgi:hypothetical protein